MSNKLTLISNKPLSTMDILGTAFSVSKTAFSRTLPFYVLIVIATLLLNTIFIVMMPPENTVNEEIQVNIVGPQTSTQTTMVSTTSTQISTQTSETPTQTSPLVKVVEVQANKHPVVQNNLSSLTIFLGLLISLVLTYAIYAFYTASIFRVQGIMQSQDPGFSPSLKVGYRKSIPFIVVGFLYSIAFSIGLMLLIVPGIMVSIYFIFSAYLLVLGSSIFGSFGDSYRLVKGHWWFTTLNMGVLFLILIILGLFAVLSVSMLIPSITLIAINPILGVIAAVISLIVFAVLLVLIYLYATAYMLVCINDLKLRKTLNPTV